MSDLEGWDLGPHLKVFFGDDGVAEVVFGPAGAMPFLDVEGHAHLGSVWQRLEAQPGVRSILVRSEGKGFCAGGTPAVVSRCWKARTRDFVS